MSYMESPVLTPKEVDVEKLTPVIFSDPTKMPCSACRGQMSAEFLKKFL